MWGNPTLLDLLKKYWEKIIGYWKKAMDWEKQILKQSIKKSFLVVLVTTNNAIYRDPLILSLLKHQKMEKQQPKNRWLNHLKSIIDILTWLYQDLRHPALSAHKDYSKITCKDVRSKTKNKIKYF